MNIHEILKTYLIFLYQIPLKQESILVRLALRTTLKFLISLCRLVHFLLYYTQPQCVRVNYKNSNEAGCMPPALPAPWRSLVDLRSDET